MKREQARACIEAVGIFPGIRVDRADEALYSAETLYEAGIPIAEITMTVPGTIEVIRQPCGAVPESRCGCGNGAGLRAGR